MTVSELEIARKQVTFPVNELHLILNGGLEGCKTKQKVLQMVENNPVFSKTGRNEMNRKERLERALKINKEVINLRVNSGLTDEEGDWLLKLIDEYTPVSNSIESKITLHFGMFIPVLKAQCSEEQYEKWVPKAERCEIIGCYSQTELGHGSNLSGLETTATFIKETDEFELNSPSLTSVKWWSGGLGIISTHSLIQAKLIIDGKNYGVHLFVVPIRSLNNHKPFKGVTVGDIGPKFGFTAVDNGFVKFDKYRIPRENMLQRYAKVDRNGNYSKPPHDRIGYGGMVWVRALLVYESSLALARSCVIATRYCLVRRQFNKDNQNAMEETQVIDYSMVQFRLFPLIARTYALFFTGQKMMSQYKELEKQLSNNDVTNLAEVHAISSGLKSYTTAITAEGIEEARKICGGHGYSSFSGFPQLYADYVATNTYEGDNYLLTQQLTRYLLKLFRKGHSLSTKFSQTLMNLAQENISEWKVEKIDDLKDSSNQSALLGHRLIRQLFEILKKLKKGSEWSQLNPEAYEISRSFCEYYVHLCFTEAIDEIKSSNPKLYNVMKLTLDLYFCDCVTKEIGEFLIDGFLLRKQAELIKAEQRRIMKEMRNEAIGLVEAFGLPEFLLNSALGRADGKVYEALFKSATKNNPANTISYEKFIKPVFQQSKL